LLRSRSRKEPNHFSRAATRLRNFRIENSRKKIYVEIEIKNRNSKVEIEIDVENPMSQSKLELNIRYQNRNQIRNSDFDIEIKIKISGNRNIKILKKLDYNFVRILILSKVKKYFCGNPTFEVILQLDSR
jgi:hypothetical protein